MDITVLQSGFVTKSSLDPIGYAGEMNSRILNITHPLFDNSIYQLIVVKEKRPYVLGIENGKIIIPPSLLDISTTLDCQFIAIRKNEKINNCGCLVTYSNDCSTMLFKSDKFTLTVGEGLNISNLTPIPPYETLLDMYNNLNKAKMSVETAKVENQQISDNIENNIDALQSSVTAAVYEAMKPYIDKLNELQDRLDNLTNN